MRHVLHICNVIYNSSHCIRNCVDVVGHPGSPHFPDHHGWTIEAVQDRLDWSSRVYSLFGPPWMTKSSEQRQNSGAGRVGQPCTRHVPSAVGALWASTALGTPQSGHGSGRGRVGMLAKNHFTLQKVNTDDLYNALMLCEVNVEVTSLCVK